MDLFDFLQLLLCTTHNVDFGSVDSKSLSAHQTDAASAACDQSDLALDIEHLSEVEIGVVRHSGL